MPFPLPLCPDLRKIIVDDWLNDVQDRLSLGQPENAEQSWRIANKIYLDLPPGCGDTALEGRLYQLRVSLDNLSITINEDREHHPNRNRCQGGEHPNI